MIIGILGIQGSREEHAEILKGLKIDILYVRTPQDLDKVKALIIPGGESTTIGMLMKRNKLMRALKKRLNQGMPVYGTCAGAILLAKKIRGAERADTLEAMNIEVERNAYGGQLDSFIKDVEIPVLGKKNFEAVFIRAPKIKSASKNVEILAKCDGLPVMVKEGNLLVSTFHPELTEDNRVHKYFLKMVYESE